MPGRSSAAAKARRPKRSPPFRTLASRWPTARPKWARPSRGRWAGGGSRTRHRIRRVGMHWTEIAAIAIVAIALTPVGILLIYAGAIAWAWVSACRKQRGNERGRIYESEFGR